MAAQKSLRAFINSAPRRGIQLAKVKLREEGEKKVQELKAKIPTPQELVEKLSEKYGQGNLDPKTGVFTPVE